MNTRELPFELHFETPAAVVRTAFLVAAWAHRDQRRKHGTPYIEHPVAVAEIVTDLGNCTYEVTAAGFLHDVLEDTEVTDLSGFPTQTIELVELLTKRAGKIDYWQAIWDDPDARLLKAADRLSNLTDALLADGPFRRRYARLTRRDMAQWLDDPVTGPLLAEAVRKCEANP